MLLDGVRVLDVTRVLTGGYCTRVLADVGAAVTKVEVSTRGDPIRSLPNGEAYFEALHHGKPVVQIALKTEAGRARLLELAETADVLLEGFRPGVMDRRQVGWDQLRAVNPRLIYCSITGYGSSGSLRDRAGHDLNYLARSGALSVMPRANGVPMIPGVQTADLAGGMMAAIAVLGALVERQQSGRGRRLDVSMTDVAKSWLVLQRGAFDAGVPMLNLVGGLPCYHVYRAADGLLTVGALEPTFWRTFCEAIGREDLVPRQADPGAIPEVAGVLAAKTQAEGVVHFCGPDRWGGAVLGLVDCASPA